MWSRMVVTGDGGSKCVGALWSRAEARRRISGQVHTRLLTFFLFSFSWFCNCFFFFLPVPRSGLLKHERHETKYKNRTPLLRLLEAEAKNPPLLSRSPAKESRHRSRRHSRAVADLMQGLRLHLGSTAPVS